MKTRVGSSLPTLVLSVLATVLSAAPARAQLVQPSFSVGTAVPVRNQAESFGAGLHLGVALKLPLLPLQFEGAVDRMAAEDDGGEDLSIWSGGLAFPVSLTPPLLPVGVYLVAGGGLYRYEAGTTSTDVGVSAGAGVRVGLGLSLFAEGRGILVLAEDRLTYVNASLGIRF